MVQKKKIFFVVLIAFLIAGCNGSGTESRGTPEAPVIEIEVRNGFAGKAYLFSILGDQQYLLDSAIVGRNGKMVFQRSEPIPGGMFFLQLPDRSYFPFLIDQDQTFSLKTSAGHLAEAMEVEGSLDNELFYRAMHFETGQQPQLDELAGLLKINAPGTPAYLDAKQRQDQLLDERDRFLRAIYDEYPDAFFTKFKKAGENPKVQELYRPDGSLDTAASMYNYRTKGLWKEIDLNDERLLRTPVIANKLSRYINELTPQKPDSVKQAITFLLDQVLDKPAYFRFFANWITLRYEPGKTTSLMDPEAIFVFMIRNYYTRDRAVWADSMLIYSLQQRAGQMAPSLIGEKGPDVAAKDPAGRLLSISGIKAPYLIVYLYNPTCEHCMVETPKLLSFYRQWKDKGVEVYAIALDTNVQEWKNFIAKNGLNWVNVFDPTHKAFLGKYFVDNTPEIYVLNPDRIIIGKNLRVNQIEAVIRQDMAQIR